MKELNSHEVNLVSAGTFLEIMPAIALGFLGLYSYSIYEKTKAELVATKIELARYKNPDDEFESHENFISGKT